MSNTPIQPDETPKPRVEVHAQPQEEPVAPAEEATPESAAPKEGEQNEEGKKEKKSDPAGDVFSWLQALTAALLVLIILFTFCGRVIGVDGHSMDSTLADHDMLLIQCVAYEPQQGDIVVLHKDFGDITTPIVKRVIAVGGQTVQIDYDTGTVYVDGQALDEPYINEPMMVPDGAYMQGTYWEIPEGSVFVMGDNRNRSLDSRDERLGPVDNRYILGKAQFVILPFQHIQAIG